MRVYIPATLAVVERMLAEGEIRSAVAYAVTPALRESYAGGDTEELEYAALLEAARASLRLLAEDPGAPPRRVVLAADVGDGIVARDPGARSAVRLTGPIPLRLIASGHIDDDLAEADVDAARSALAKADAGDDDAAFVVDGAEGHELGWYATQELAFLLDSGG